MLGLFLQETAPGEPVARLLFSTHHNDLMDLCGRFRTTLVNKDNNQSEIPDDVIRNDRLLVPPCNDRRFGGVPRL